jgi:hypothetical protein
MPVVLGSSGRQGRTGSMLFEIAIVRNGTNRPARVQDT